ncbi:MAG: hypothetical protein AAGI46_08305 [Planctomycetota bacterium]
MRSVGEKGRSDLGPVSRVGRQAEGVTSSGIGAVTQASRRAGHTEW